MIEYTDHVFLLCSHLEKETVNLCSWYRQVMVLYKTKPPGAFNVWWLGLI